jgi:putrescine transport system permease protein
MSHSIVRFFFYMGYLFLYIPLALVVIYSFNSSPSIAWQGVSLKWYYALFENEDLLVGAYTSLKIGLLSASLATALGTICANAWTQHQRSVSYSALGFLATVPLVIPEIVIGLGCLLFFTWVNRHFGWPTKGFVTIVAAHTTLGAAYVTAIVRARLLSIDPTLTEAALDLGARPNRVFFLIKFPIILPTLVGSWLIAFIISFDDVILASFTSGPGIVTLPLMIFSSLKMGYSPQINALATCFVVAVSVLITLVSYMLYRKEVS